MTAAAHPAGETESIRRRTIDFLPRGNTLTDAEWTRRHRLLLVVLGLQVPLLIAVGASTGWPVAWIGGFVGWTVALTVLGALVHHRRLGSFLVTLGLTSCSIELVVLSNGSIEAHFHFFVIVGFLALYQDWFPFLWNIAFTVLSHGIGAAFIPDLIFNHLSGQANPWLWSLVHGLSVLAACAGVLLFWRYTEDLQDQKTELAQQLAQSELSKKEFTSDLLLNLARRNQGMYHRQLEIINDLEDKERDPDVLAELFRLDHLATRVRRNAESLLVLSGERTPRVWSAPVSLRDVVRAAIAETEDLDRITFTVDEGLAVVGSSVADLTHLLAELLENAVRFSPPTSTVTVTNRPYHPSPGSHLLVVEDTGVGMPAGELARANELLATPQEVDVSASRQLGFHVVARLAERHGISATLTPTPGCGLTAVLVLPAGLFPSTTAAVRRSAPPALVSIGHDDDRRNGSAGSNGADGVPRVVDGRHAFPGTVERAATHDHSGDHRRDEPWAPAAGSWRPTDVPAVPLSRGGLIHPVAVPPPAAGTTAPAPRSSPEGPRVESGQGDTGRPEADRGANGGTPRRILTQRVPQSHLAPELAGRTGAVPAALPAQLLADPPSDSPSGPPSDHRSPPAAVSGSSADRPETSDHDVAAGPGGALTALSRYQASRRMARLEIDEAHTTVPYDDGSTS